MILRPNRLTWHHVTVILAAATSVLSVPPSAVAQSRATLLRQARDEFNPQRRVEILWVAANPELGPLDGTWNEVVERLANALIETGRESEAATWFRWALRLNPEFAPDPIVTPRRGMAAYDDARQFVSRSVAPIDAPIETHWEWPVAFTSQGPSIRVDGDAVEMKTGSVTYSSGVRASIAAGSHVFSANVQPDVAVTVEALPGITLVLRARVQAATQPSETTLLGTSSDALGPVQPDPELDPLAAFWAPRRTSTVPWDVGLRIKVPLETGQLDAAVADFLTDRWFVIDSNFVNTGACARCAASRYWVIADPSRRSLVRIIRDHGEWIWFLGTTPDVEEQMAHDMASFLWSGKLGSTTSWGGARLRRTWLPSDQFIRHYFDSRGAVFSYPEDADYSSVQRVLTEQSSALGLRPHQSGASVTVGGTAYTWRREFIQPSTGDSVAMIVASERTRGSGNEPSGEFTVGIWASNERLQTQIKDRLEASVLENLIWTRTDLRRSSNAQRSGILEITLQRGASGISRLNLEQTLVVVAGALAPHAPLGPNRDNDNGYSWILTTEGARIRVAVLRTPTEILFAVHSPDNMSVALRMFARLTRGLLVQ